MSSKSLCIICAWRHVCKKRFIISSEESLHCPDFVEDVTIKKEEDKKDAGNRKKTS
jgi:hypothetical protein